jgi:hypothetical protein
MWAVLPRTNILTGIVVTAGIVLPRWITHAFQGLSEAFGQRTVLQTPLLSPVPDLWPDTL